MQNNFFFLSKSWYRPPRLAFAICRWRWQNDVHEIKYSVCETHIAIDQNKINSILAINVERGRG